MYSLLPRFWIYDPCAPEYVPFSNSVIDAIKYDSANYGSSRHVVSRKSLIPLDD